MNIDQISKILFDEMNPDLSIPIYDHDWDHAYVTDGRVAFRLPKEASTYRVQRDGQWIKYENGIESQCFPPRTPLTSLRFMFNAIDMNATTTDLPEINKPADADDLWNYNSECDECLGTGEVECEYGHDHECPDCGGEGDVSKRCDEAKSIVTVNGRDFRKLYVWLITEFSNAKALDFEFDKARAFKFDEGLALICPCVDDNEYKQVMESRRKSKAD